jgi:hypothetical protein
MYALTDEDTVGDNRFGNLPRRKISPDAHTLVRAEHEILEGAPAFAVEVRSHATMAHEQRANGKKTGRLFCAGMFVVGCRSAERRSRASISRLIQAINDLPSRVAEVSRIGLTMPSMTLV